MVNKDLGMVTAYAYAVSKGYTGTEEEFAELMADYADVGQRAEAAATAAAASATAASGSASDSAASATAAEGFAGNASTAAGNAAQSATQASQSATAASGSASDSAASATAAAGSATTAGNKATEAAGSATAAAGSATTAGASATAAQAAQTAAETAQTAAETAQGAAEDAAESVEGKTEQIDQNTEDISLLKSHLEAIQIVDTASGAIATFPDGSDGIPVESLTVTMEPIQDLHGQDAPYPPGGKGNLFNYEAWKGVSVLRGTAVFENNGVTITATENDAYTVFASTSGGFPEEARIPVAEGETITLAWEETVNTDGSVYIFPNGSASGAVNVNNRYVKKVSYTAGSGVTFVSFRLGVTTAGDSISYKNIQVVKGTTVPAWAPYSNICPISGRQSVTVTRSGVNVWDEETELGIYNMTTGQPEASNYSIRGKNRISVIPNTAYYANSTYIRRLYYDENDQFISANSRLGADTTPSNCHFMRIYLADTYGTTYNHDISINYPSTDHDYHPGTVASVEVQLGQTVYGGTLDVTTGEMVVDRAMVTYDGSSDEEWAVTGTRQYIQVLDSVPGNYTETIGKYIANYLAYANIVSDSSAVGIILNNRNFQIRVSTDITTVAQLRAYLEEHPLEVAYMLETPITITLTPEQLTTVLGQNNVWSDGGNVTVDYVADTKLFIEQLTEPDADMVADANITSGQYFMVGNSLFLATANIASGAAITPGVNCTRTSLAAALNAINA